MTLGEDCLYSLGVNKIREECLQQIRGLEVHLEITEGNIGELTLESIRIPSQLPARSGSSDNHLKLSLDQNSSSIGPRSEIQGGSKRSLAKKSPSWRN